MTSQRVLLGVSLAPKMEKVPCGRVSKKTSKKDIGKYCKISKKCSEWGIQVIAFWELFGSFFVGVPQYQEIPGNYEIFDQKHTFFNRKRFRSGQPLRAKLYTWAPQVPTNWRGGTQACLLNNTLYNL